MLGLFERAVAEGHHPTWVLYTILVSKVTPLTLSDREAQQLLVRHLNALKRRYRREGEAFEAGWSLERRGRLGLHAHVTLSCPPHLAPKARAAIAETLSRLTGKQVCCPALKFRSKRDDVSGVSQARGWWVYGLKSAVRDGDVVHGIRGKLHRPVAAKPRGWVRGARQ